MLAFLNSATAHVETINHDTASAIVDSGAEQLRFMKAQ